VSNTRKTKPEPLSVKDLIAGARLPERSVSVCLRGDLIAEHQALEDDLRRAEETARQSDARMSSLSESKRIAEQLDEISDQMTANTLNIRLRALPRPEWVALIGEYQPPPDDPEAQRVGVDLEPFLQVATRRCVVEPAMDDDDWAALVKVLSSAEWDKLAGACWSLNRTGVDIPKSQLASLVKRRIAESSK
jgi:hypothetical protein